MLWPKALTEDMVERHYADGAILRTYPDLPKNMYTAMKNTANRLPNKTAIVDEEIGRAHV